MGEAAQSSRARVRAGVSLTLALALHAMPAAVFLWWQITPSPVVALQAPASMVMMPVPMALPAPRRDTPPGPEQIQADAPTPPREKPRPLVPVPSDILPETSPAPSTEPQSDQPPAPETTAPPTAPLPPDDTPAAPVERGVSVDAAAVPQWQGQVLGHLDRHKRYPAEASRKRREGVPYVRFALDREGRVLFARLEKSCGVASLDEEAVALVFRAQPFPKPPPEVPGNAIEMVAPIEFFMR